jgi:hypothetical protein
LNFSSIMPFSPNFPFSHKVFNNGAIFSIFIRHTFFHQLCNLWNQVFQLFINCATF